MQYGYEQIFAGHMFSHFWVCVWSCWIFWSCALLTKESWELESETVKSIKYIGSLVMLLALNVRFIFVWVKFLQASTRGHSWRHWHMTILSNHVPETTWGSISNLFLVKWQWILLWVLKWLHKKSVSYLCSLFFIAYQPFWVI